LFAPQAETKGIALRLELGAIPDAVLIDSARLRQILLNLVGNAVKFTDTGSVTLKAGFASGRLQFEICDTGPGIPDDQFEKLFKRFSQVDSTTRRSHGGTGLGLAICKGLVDAMGGTIEARSVAGEGSIFSVRIPADVVESSAAAREDEQECAGFAGLRILVADDNKANRILIEAMLQSLGARLVLAENGCKAVEAASAARFDVVLMDLHMPEMNGYDAARAIRHSAGPSAGAPILAFTADSTLRPDREHATLFDGIVRKPVMPEALLAAIGAATMLPAQARLGSRAGQAGNA
jgi:CheY-like chemotaxis protein/anti-sigma regulatory factor (Ser/Thr protein kinase)